MRISLTKTEIDALISANNQYKENYARVMIALIGEDDTKEIIKALTGEISLEDFQDITKAIYIVNTESGATVHIAEDLTVDAIEYVQNTQTNVLNTIEAIIPIAKLFIGKQKALVAAFTEKIYNIFGK